MRIAVDAGNRSGEQRGRNHANRGFGFQASQEFLFLIGGGVVEVLLQGGAVILSRALVETD